MASLDPSRDTLGAMVDDAGKPGSTSDGGPATAPEDVRDARKQTSDGGPATAPEDVRDARKRTSDGGPATAPGEVRGPVTSPGEARPSTSVTSPGEARPSTSDGGPVTAPGEARRSTLGGGPVTAPGETRRNTLGGGPVTSPEVLQTSDDVERFETRSTKIDAALAPTPLPDSLTDSLSDATSPGRPSVMNVVEPAATDEPSRPDDRHSRETIRPASDPARDGNDSRASDPRLAPTPRPGDGDNRAVDATARPAAERATRTSASPNSGVIQLPPGGYDLGDVIGKGGMGEVLAATDLKFGRDLAVKRMHGTQSARAVTRFLREARVQARLQHPAIVPVHDLGTDREGRPYFTMKRLSGVELANQIKEDAEVGPLLRAFVEVLLAIDFAHSKRIVHRDLKPANIMLGEFGEVYVLDWGVARDLAERDDTATSEPESGQSNNALATKAGSVLGTPGYMSPEQVRGEPIDTAADIYALGAILFEILTAEPLHPRGELALMSTLTTGPQSPAERRPERAIAPELDALCVAAQADEAADRPTARAMAERLRKYIDGDRDLERRRTLAKEQLATARTALDSDSPDGRALAMRHAGRALALDPESGEAADFVGRLVLEKPEVMPPALVASLDERDRDAIRKRSRRAASAYGAVFGFLAVVPFLDVRSWGWLVAFYAALGAIVAFALRGMRTGTVSPFVSMLLNGTVAIVATRIASPFILAPVMICGALIAVASHPWNQARPWTIFAWAASVVGLPFILEAAGVLEKTWMTEEGSLRIASSIYAIHGGAEAAVLITANLAFVLLLGAFALTITRTRRDAERELHIQAWHLRHLIDR